MILGILLAVLLGVFTLVLGSSALVVLWPVAALSFFVLYCLDRPVRRAAWPIVLVVMLGAGIAYDLGPWDARPGGLAALAVFAAPLVLGVVLLALCGGPARIRARHLQADERRRMLRRAHLALRREARRDAIRERTGVDVGLLGTVTRDRAGRATRAVGDRINRRLEKRRPAGSAPAGPPEWLDLDRDVSSDLSQQQRDEIRDLAERLDRTNPRSG